jgi:hypothetical protein
LLNKRRTSNVGARSLDKQGYAEEDDGDANAAIFVKYDRMLHGQDRRRGKKAKQDRLTVKFLKKYIHYAKNLIQPKLTDEVTFPILDTEPYKVDGDIVFLLCISIPCFSHQCEGLDVH